MTKEWHGITPNSEMLAGFAALAKAQQTGKPHYYFKRDYSSKWGVAGWYVTDKCLKGWGAVTKSVSPMGQITVCTGQ